MNIDFPLRFDGRGRTAEVGDEEHVRQLIEQVLFTAPGERVNRLTFGSGLRQLIFQPNGDELVATTQLLAQGALQQWLGNLIQVEEVSIENDEETLRVLVRYVIRRTGRREEARYALKGRGA